MRGSWRRVGGDFKCRTWDIGLGARRGGPRPAGYSRPIPGGGVGRGDGAGGGCGGGWGEGEDGGMLITRISLSEGERERLVV